MSRQIKNTELQKSKNPAANANRANERRSGTTRNRTGDTRIFSPLLYKLSYGTIMSAKSISLICGCKGTTFYLFHKLFLAFLLKSFIFHLILLAFLIHFSKYHPIEDWKDCGYKNHRNQRTEEYHGCHRRP